jgi:hypothetical protein
MNISHTNQIFSFQTTTFFKPGQPAKAILSTEATYPKTIDKRVRVLTAVTIHCVGFVLCLPYETRNKHKIWSAEPVHVFGQKVMETCATLKLCAQNIRIASSIGPSSVGLCLMMGKDSVTKNCFNFCCNHGKTDRV